jgi:tetratricopeptide (TPR) repeat protein
MKETMLDSILIMANKALSIDDNLDEAYVAKGYYYSSKGNKVETLNNINKALEINPNSFSALFFKAQSLSFFTDNYDFVEGLDCWFKALNRAYGNDLRSLLPMLARILLDIGFIDKARFYYDEALNLFGDSVAYYGSLSLLEFTVENINGSILFGEKALKIDSTYIPDFANYNFTGQYEKAYLFAEKYVRFVKRTGNSQINNLHRIGYSFWMVGKKKEAEYYFKEQIRIAKESIEKNAPYAVSKWAHYDLAGVYAFLGDEEEAYKYLDEYNSLNFFSRPFITLAKYDPLFRSIRNQDRFQKILHNMEARFQAEHERVRKWLEDQGMLSKE